VQVILLEEQKGIVAKESVPSKNSKGKRFYQLVVNILNLKGLKILNVFKRSLFINNNYKKVKSMIMKVVQAEIFIMYSHYLYTYPQVQY